jgi:hypothetical protein
MGWFTKSPFSRDGDPVKHMVELLSEKGEICGTPITDSDRAILAKESSEAEPLPEDLKCRAKQLIAQIFKDEPWDEFGGDPKELR